MTTADERDTQQAQEWNTYLAAVPIDYFGTRAYNTGDPVPVSAVEGDTGWIDPQWVRRVGDVPNEGSQTAPPPEPPTIDTTLTAAPAASTPQPPPDAATAAPDTASTTEG